MTLAQQTYLDRLNAIEAEKLAALEAPGSDADRVAIVALRKMSAALQALRPAQLKAPRS